MFPILIDLGTWDLPLLGETPIFLPTYGVLFALSLVVAWYWFTRRARTLGVAEEPLFNLTFYTVIAGILGAKLTLVLVDWNTYVEHPELIPGLLRVAGVLIGGVIAGALMFYVYSRKHGMQTWALGDAIAAHLALAQGIGRLGCHAAGCCWGAQTHADHPLAVTFSDPRATAQTGVPLNRPLIATQLIQMILDVTLALVLTLLWRKRPQPDGTVFWIYVLLYSLTRGSVEFWRGDAARGLWFDDGILWFDTPVSTSQLFALAGIGLATFFLVRGQLRRRRA